MATGRCAGCGCAGSVKQIRAHVMTCPHYTQLFRTDPDRCLDPAAEHQRYRTQDDTCQARAERRQHRLAAGFAETQRLHALQTARWRQPKDILDED